MGIQAEQPKRSASDDLEAGSRPAVLNVSSMMKSPNPADAGSRLFW